MKKTSSITRLSEKQLDKPKLLDKTCPRNRIHLIEKKIKNFFTVKSLQIFKKTAQLAKLRYNDVIIT